MSQLSIYQRPNPDSLLEKIRENSEAKGIGKLKIFFGYAPGVGKTYAMLEAAQEAKKQGLDVVCGYIEPHTRPETMALVEGLERLPVKAVTHKGITLNEFDLDGALKRNPALILVDELAHTNAPGSRHKKRYQDIEELLKAGIDVYTTVNVQHLEGLNDIVASITGVVVSERIPDSVFDQAQFVEITDIEPKDLIDRLNKGKIYKAMQAQKALDNFFSKENLVALREIALRRTADRVNRTVEANKALMGEKNYHTDEHILVCLSPSASNGKVIRNAARLADAFHGTLTALLVETPDHEKLTLESKKQLKENIRLAEQLGAKIATVYGEDIPELIAEYAKAAGVSKIVIGRTRRKAFFFKSKFIEHLTDLTPNMDIYIIPNKVTTLPVKANSFGKPKWLSFSIIDTLKSLGVLTLVTLIGLWFYELQLNEANIITVYIFGVLVIAMITEGKVYSALSSLFSVVMFNFFFASPQFSLKVYDASYPIIFIIMFLAAFLTSTLTMRVKEQARQSAKKAYRTEILLDTSQKLQRANNTEEILTQTAVQMIKLLDKTIIFYPVEDSGLGSAYIFPREGQDGASYLSADERGVAQWVYKNNKHAGATTNTLPGSKCLYLAVRGKKEVFAVAAIAMDDAQTMDLFEKNILIAMLGECALALENQKSDEIKNRLALQAQQEQLRANLLTSISHDLRTPLTTISGNASILVNNGEVLEAGQKAQLYTDIYDDAMWLINLVENLLSITRIEDGSMHIKMEPELIGDVICEALKHINRISKQYTIEVELEDDLLMAAMDSQLIIQVIVNILDNAFKYTKPGTHIVIGAKKVNDDIVVEIKDDGPGIPDAFKDNLFDMFFVGASRKDGRRGLGIGLSLCKSIIEAHGGTLTEKDNKPHGSIFIFTLNAVEVNEHE